MKDDTFSLKKSSLLGMYCELLIEKQSNDKYVLQNVFGLPRVDEEFEKKLKEDNIKLEKFFERLNEI